MTQILVIEDMADDGSVPPDFGPREPGEYRGYYEDVDGGQFLFRRRLQDKVGFIYSGEIGWCYEFEITHYDDTGTYDFDCQSSMMTQIDPAPLFNPIVKLWIDACVVASKLCNCAAHAHRNNDIADDVDFNHFDHDDDDDDDDDDDA